MFIAHIRKKHDKQTVAEHCRKAAKYAGEALIDIGFGNTAYVSGLLHDMGKCTRAFNEYIHKAASGEKVQRGSVNHTFAGTRFILELLHETDDNNKKLLGEVIAVAVGAHHGLFDCINEDGKNGFSHRMEKEGIFYSEARDNYLAECASEEEIKRIVGAACEELVNLLRLFQSMKPKNQGELLFYFGLYCRLILSAVIDGDRKDTAEFMLGENFQRGLPNNFWQENLSYLVTRLEQKKSIPGTEIIGKAREDISLLCEQSGLKKVGVYRLNVPTGGGKTLSSLRFALRHAAENNKQRIIFVMPLLAIIEQNAKEIREHIKNSEMLLEHHSNVISETEDGELDERELIIDSWRMPVIITTLVQMLNTLFSGKTSSIRRFSSLCNSIIVFDEIQTVPPKMISLFNMACNFLATVCNATVILCSATQPCLEKTEHPLSDISDLISLDDEFLRKFKRVNLVDKEVMNKSDIVKFANQLITKIPSLLVVCNLKQEAKELYEEILQTVGEGVKVIHLSAGMCTAHRTSTVEEIKSTLRSGQRVICVSTQVIEAGVDISFAGVIRLRAGMDSIIQAAGRCNRNGESKEPADVYIVGYAGENLNRLRDIDAAKTATTKLLYNFSEGKMQTSDMMSDEAIEFYYSALYKEMPKYYQDYYIKKYSTTIYELLSENGAFNKEDDNKYILPQAFKTAGYCFEVFDNQTTEVIVPFGAGKEYIAELCSAGEKGVGYLKKILKSVRPYTVAIYDYQKKLLMEKGGIFELAEMGIYILQPEFYDEKIGLLMEPVASEPLFI